MTPELVPCARHWPHSKQVLGRYYSTGTATQGSIGKPVPERRVVVSNLSVRVAAALEMETDPLMLASVHVDNAASIESIKMAMVRCEPVGQRLHQV